MDDLSGAIDAAAGADFSGVVRIDVADRPPVARAYGLAHRGWAVPNEVGTRFGTASGTKTFTALVVMSLVEQGLLALDTTARSVLGDDLPLVDAGVTVGHLLAHRSGVGDYFDEELLTSMTDYVMPVPVHRLVTTSDYLPVLEGHPQVFPPGERFAYNNSGFVVLALIAERVSGTSYADLVQQRVCGPAGMVDSGFPRGDEPGAGVATGYLFTAGLRTNVLHLPVVGTGDGGLVTTAADLAALWSALFAGRIVPLPTVEQMVRPGDGPWEESRYGLGFWIDPVRDEVVSMAGGDAGVWFRSAHDRSSGTTLTVLSNTTEGAWPVFRDLRDRLGC